MARSRMMLLALSVLVLAGALFHRSPVQAQSTSRSETGDAAVAALVAEVRALRADMATASRNQLRAQMLLGRVQMQEQRLAYLDKQRADTATQAAMQAQMTSALRNQVQGFDSGGCTNLPAGEPRRDCEAQGAMMRRQAAELETREQQLRAQERELESAMSAEQARWSEFNARLDELERTLR